jgi:hypothetical protein
MTRSQTGWNRAREISDPNHGLTSDIADYTVSAPPARRPRRLIGFRRIGACTNFGVHGAKIVSISEDAVLQRINRRLKPDLRGVKKTRGARAYHDLGDYYLIDYDRNWIVDHHLDLEDLARELGCLADDEQLAEEGA